MLESIQYRGFDDLTALLWRSMMRIPRDVDIVIGVPRSGLVPAFTIALLRNLQVVDLPAFLAGAVGGTGKSRGPAVRLRAAGDARRALLVDDSVNTGAAMKEAVERLRAAFPDLRVTTLAVYGVADARSKVDILLETVSFPRVFEWNLFHTGMMERACLDMDGVLCVDPKPEENDDGPAYRRFLETAEPLMLPTRKVRKIVTSRLEKYRPETEAWLARHGVAHEQLVMLDLPSAEERRRSGAHGAFKAGVFRADARAMFFVESEAEQAQAIAKRAGKPCFDMGSRQMLYPGDASVLAVAQRARGSAATLIFRARRKMRI